MRQVVVQKGRVTTLQVALGFDVSQDEFASQIRADKDDESTLIATWTIGFSSDGVDGELIFTLDDTARVIEHANGWMDAKRVSNGKALPVWNEPLEVIFEDTITV